MSNNFGYQILCYDPDDSRERPIHVGDQGGLNHSEAVWINNSGVSVTGIGGINLATEAKQDDSIVYLNDIYTDMGTSTVQLNTYNELVNIGTSVNAIRDYTEIDYVFRVADNQVTGESIVNKFGFNKDIDISSSPEILASFGGTWDFNNIMTSADTFDITYNNTTDGLGQTGALSLLIDYLDGNFTLQQGVHVLGNTGTDTTSFSGLGINRVVVISNGGAGYNTNDITISDTIGTFGTQAQVPALESVTQQLIYHTPINSNFFLNFWKFNTLKTGSGANPVIQLRGYSYSRVTATRYNIFDLDIDTTVSNFTSLDLNQPLVFGGREVLYFDATTDKDNSVVNARFSGILKQ